MDNVQIAHDLAVAKLSGSDLPCKELCDTYRKYFNEILDYLKSEPSQTTTKFVNSPF